MNTRTTRDKRPVHTCMHSPRSRHDTSVEVALRVAYEAKGVFIKMREHIEFNVDEDSLRRGLQLNTLGMRVYVTLLIRSAGGAEHADGSVETSVCSRLQSNHSIVMRLLELSVTV
jgi:hypothetical protein